MLEINYNKRIYGLDVFRSLAILIVMIQHSSILLKNTILEGFPYIPLVDGVDLFFVLSGFLIGSLLLKEINKSEFIFWDLFKFWVRRWLRTLPNYYLILFVNIILVHYKIIHGNENKISWKFLVFFQNFNSPFTDFFWESWSLSVEEWFYLLFGICLFICIKIFKASKSYLIVSLLLIILPLIYRISINHKQVDEFWWDVTFRKTVLARLDAIGYGTLLAYLFYFYKEDLMKYKNHLFAIGLIFLIFTINSSKEVNSFFFKTLYFSLCSFSISLILPFFYFMNKGNFYLFKFFTITSVLSYSLYLINLPVESILEIHFDYINGIVKFLLFWIFSYLLSFILYKYYEKPIMDLRDKF